MSSAFSNALADFLEIKVVHIPPALAVDMAGAILDAVVIQLGQHTDETVFFNTDFVVESESIIGNLFLSPEPESVDKILVALREKLGL
jgi:chemotaxis protein CheC